MSHVMLHVRYQTVLFVLRYSVPLVMHLEMIAKEKRSKAFICQCTTVIPKDKPVCWKLVGTFIRSHSAKSLALVVLGLEPKLMYIRTHQDVRELVAVCVSQCSSLYSREGKRALKLGLWGIKIKKGYSVLGCSLYLFKVVVEENTQ